jgi:hypothetical protein
MAGTGLILGFLLHSVPFESCTVGKHHLLYFLCHRFAGVWSSPRGPEGLVIPCRGSQVVDFGDPL